MFSIDDVIHKNLRLPEYVVDIIKTPHFSRLRNLKQLGTSYKIFKKATHTRYEHCIGTAYLCQQILSDIELNCDINIDEIHKKCVILAGLLHDLGHGPFSHLWEHCVRKGTDQEWTHESQSVEMIEHMIETNKISLDDDPEIHQRAIKLISSLITGDCETWQQLLKPSEFYLTEIVSNKFCNIDVDKLDYLLRDHYYVNLPILPFERFFNNARVVFDDNGYSHIAYHCEDFHLIENMFINRATYHNEVYQNQNVAGIERQVQDICQLASEGGLKIADLPLTELQRDCNAYLQLDDSILDLIRVSAIESAKMKEAQRLLKHLDECEYYKFIYEGSDSILVYEDLTSKFGDIFCQVRKVIPNASIPTNIPLYDDEGYPVSKISKHDLCYESVLIFCKAFDAATQQSIINFFDEVNNNSKYNI